DRITTPPASMRVLAGTGHAPVAAARCGHLWGVQFHPEVTETIDGQRMLSNFCFEICGVSEVFPAKDEASIKVAELRHQNGADKAKIKQHHNVGLEFSRPEILPLSDCVKDDARSIGRAVGAPEDLLSRHPFPGPGLLVRIEGEVDAVKLAVARQVDGIYISE